VKSIEIVDSSFCARRSATSREYEYFILNRSHPSPFLDRYSHFVARRLNLKAMREAAQFLVGTHDFSAFCVQSTRPETSSRRTPVRGRPIRTVFELACRRTDKPVKGLLIIRIRANAFLHNMVRTIVGTLLEVGLGNLTPGAVKEIIERKERTKAGPTAPAKALFLTNVSY
jgi:tRNA pseudouridine38-40 synthase